MKRRFLWRCGRGERHHRLNSEDGSAITHANSSSRDKPENMHVTGRSSRCLFRGRDLVGDLPLRLFEASPFTEKRHAPGIDAALLAKNERERQPLQRLMQRIGRDLEV